MISLVGSKGTTLQMPAARWQEAVQAALDFGFAMNGNKEILRPDQANRMASALRKAARVTKDGLLLYLADFMNGNAVEIFHGNKV